jgi:DNA-binding response OmpR family regulator
VVDDDNSVRVTLGAVLSDAGHGVSLSATGSEALAKLRTREFDVVLADLRLDDMDGIRIVQQARRRWPDTVSLILTGYASVESAIQALRAGAYDYLCKPCPADELLLTVARAVEHRRMRIQLRRQVRDLETAIDTARELHSALSTRLEGTSALLRERDRVIATVCAELRVSFVAIAGLIDSVVAQVHAQGEAGQPIEAYLAQIRLELETLAKRVTDAVSITRTESIQIPPPDRRAPAVAITVAPGRDIGSAARPDVR